LCKSGSSKTFERETRTGLEIEAFSDDGYKCPSFQTFSHFAYINISH